MSDRVVGIIFAGGYGTRLLPLTNTTPKPLLELKSDFSILNKQIMDLKYAGIKDIKLLIGHLGDKIKSKFGNSYKGVNIQYLTEKKPMGTLWALSNALKHIDCDVIVRNGDVVTDINIKNLIDSSRKGDNLVVITVTKMQSPYGIIEFNDRNITDFKEKPTLDLFINAGVYYIKKEAFPYFTQNYNKNDIEHTVFPVLVEERKVGHYYEKCFWRSVDGIKDLETVRKEFDFRLETPWGYEKTIVNNDKYLVKVLYIKKGFCTSMHYHPSKDESMHIMDGEGFINFQGKKKSADKGSVIRIEPNKIHSIVALDNLRIFEYSTPHPNDTVRVEDYYDR